jgi:hypothetical protein
MKKILAFLIMILAMACHAQEGKIVFDHEKKQVQIHGDITAEDMIQALFTVEYPAIQKYDIVPVYPVPFMNPGQAVHYLRFTGKNLPLSPSRWGNLPLTSSRRGKLFLELWGNWKVYEFLEEVNKFDFDRKAFIMRPFYKVQSKK